MTIHAVPLLATISTDWFVGYSIGFVVVVAVVALVPPILVLAYGIGKQAPVINEALEQAVENTAPLGRTRTTIDHAGSHRRRAPPWAHPIGWLIDVLLALTSDQHHLWSITLIAGLVVLFAVVAFLSTLIALSRSSTAVSSKFATP